MKPQRIGVAVSGGRDSTALLHACARAAMGQGIEVHALHVHHGLMPEADAWLTGLQAQCQRWARSGLPLHFAAQRLQTAPERGESTEAWARRERYRALAAMAHAQGVKAVLLAHHRRDQAETFLLQALRGGGPAGLAAMPSAATRDGIDWLRPWLMMPREAIEAYVKRYRLRWVEDTSNADPRFARSRLRQAVWPAFSVAFPDAEAALSAAAARAFEASQCLAEMAGMDAKACAAGGAQLTCGSGAFVGSNDLNGLVSPAVPTSLERASLLGLSAARQANLLRHWCAPAMPAGVPQTLIDRLLQELPRARSGARWPLAPGLELRFYRGRLAFEAPSELRAEPGFDPHAEPAARGPHRLDLSRPGQYPLPAWGGVLEVRAVQTGGVSSAHLQRAELRPRQGAERFALHSAGPARSLKKQFQQLGLGEAQRQGPLVWVQDWRAVGSPRVLAFVPGLGLDARVLGQGSGPWRQLHWRGTGAP